MNIIALLLLCASSMLSGMFLQQNERSLVVQNAAAFEFQAMKDKLQKSLEHLHQIEFAKLYRRHKRELSNIHHGEPLDQMGEKYQALNELKEQQAAECQVLNQQQQQDVIEHGKLQTLDAVKYVLNMVDTKIASLIKTTKSDSLKKNPACRSVRWVDLTVPVREASKNGTNIRFEQKAIVDKCLFERQSGVIDLTELEEDSRDVINQGHAKESFPVTASSVITWSDHSIPAYNMLRDKRQITHNRYHDSEELNAEDVNILEKLLLSPVKDSPYKGQQVEFGSAVNHLLAACLFPVDNNTVDRTSVPFATTTTTTTTTLPSSPTRMLPVSELLLISPEKAARKRMGSPVGNTKKRQRLEYNEDDQDLFFDEDDFTRFN